MIGYLLRAALNVVAEYQIIRHTNAYWGDRYYIERKPE